MKRTNSLSGPLHDVAGDAGHVDHPPRVGFFTDTSVCIGCKACEVACKEWNLVPDDGFDLLGMSMDNTGSLGASTWRHVAFVEQPVPLGAQTSGLAGLPTGTSAGTTSAEVVASRLRAAERGGGELGTSPLEVPEVPEDLGMPTFQRPGDGTGRSGSLCAISPLAIDDGHVVEVAPAGFERPFAHPVLAAELVVVDANLAGGDPGENHRVFGQ